MVARRVIEAAVVLLEYSFRFWNVFWDGTKHCGGSSQTKDVCPVKDNTKTFLCARSNHKFNFWDYPSR